MTYSNQGENIGGEIQPPDDSKMYLNIASMRHVSGEFNTVVSTDNTLQIKKKITYTYLRVLMGLTAEQEDQNSSE